MTRRRDRMIFGGLNALRPLVAIGINPRPGPLLLAISGARRLVAEERLQWIRQELAQNSLADLLSVGLHIPIVDLRPRLAGAAQRPCEYVLLTSDRLCHPTMQAELAELLGAYVTTLDADHDVVITDPARYANSVVSAVVRLDDRLASGRSVPA
jgi:hypothetical protein